MGGGKRSPEGAHPSFCVQYKLFLRKSLAVPSTVHGIFGHRGSALTGWCPTLVTDTQYLIFLCSLRSSHHLQMLLETSPPRSNILSRLWCSDKARGSLLVLLSAFAFSIVTFLVDRAGARGIPSFEIMVVRCCFQMVISGVVCAWKGINPFGESGMRRVPFLRGLFGSLSTGALYYGATHLSIATATVLKFTSPLWTLLLARVTLGEPIGLANTVAIIIGFAGTVLVSQPEFLLEWFQSDSADTSVSVIDGKDIPGSWPYVESICICLLGAVCAALAYVMIRKSGGKVYYHVLGFYYGIVGAVVCSVLLVTMQGWPVLPQDWFTVGLLVAISIGGFIAQTTANKGAQMIEASKTATFRSTDVVFVLIWQISFLHEIPNAISFAGIGLITISTLIMALWTAPKSQPAKTNSENEDEEEGGAEYEMLQIGGEEPLSLLDDLQEIQDSVDPQATNLPSDQEGPESELKPENVV